MYVGYEWGSMGCFWVSERVSLWWYGRINAKTKFSMGKMLFMIDSKAFMDLGYAEKGEGMFEVKWVWTKRGDLWAWES